MLTKNALISTLIALTTLACASARPAVNKGDDNSTSVFIPPPPGWTFEDFEALKEALTRLEDALGLKNLTVEDAKIVKRAAGDSSHWCCRINPPPGTATRDIVRSRVVPKQLPVYSEYSCGLFKTCTRTSYVTTHVIEYFIETDIYEVPAEGFERGCPTEEVECCESYLRLPPHFNNCLTAQQMMGFLDVLDRLAALGLL